MRSSFFLFCCRSMLFIVILQCGVERLPVFFNKRVWIHDANFSTKTEHPAKEGRDDRYEDIGNKTAVFTLSSVDILTKPVDDNLHHIGIAF